ncbi:hypothetical protein PUR71_06625 [Streptomyces sp. SP17BM10]|uniref:hypothetical protein n=1 Tax=Streptomyces sp. SP17BM10 TaxID=3002530 RepID=UPI002E7845C4|nr:hypothetical protein [Streptomyces sp. SP17BM10]MEE1782596.1 hypothetical protein [Streptomyces sp. SP17BM10]
MTHQHTHPHAPLPAPSREGSVVLEIGGTLGALIIHTGPTEDGLEIEVSPTGDGTARTHAAVRPRHLTHRTTHCAVISPLAEGEYVIWRTPDSPEATVAVRGGQVTEHHWRT